MIAAIHRARAALAPTGNWREAAFALAAITVIALDLWALLIVTGN